MTTLIDRLFLGAIFALSAALIFLHLTPAMAHIPRLACLWCRPTTASRGARSA